MTRLRRRKIKGDGQDIFTRWRHLLILQRGYIRSVKRDDNRRERKTKQADIREQQD